MLKFLNKLFKPRTNENEVPLSKFVYYLSYIDKNDENYDTAVRAAELCGDAVQAANRRIAMIERLRELNESISGLKSYNELSDEDAVKLKDYLDRYASLQRDKRNLNNQLMGFDRSPAYIREIEEEANAAMTEIKGAEEKERMFKLDLALLESENYQLEQERQNLSTGLKFIHRFSIALIFMFGAAVLLLGYMMFVRGMTVVFPGITVVTMLILIYVFLFVFKRRALFEAELNIKKQKRAAGIINKKTVVYAHYANFLDYEYTKYKVRNSDMLKEMLSDYSLYKNINARLDSIRNILYQIEKEIEEFLRGRKLDDIVNTIESFGRTLNIDDKRNYYRELLTEKKAVENSLNSLDKSHSLIWAELDYYREQEDDEDGVISSMIQDCLNAEARAF